MKKKLLVPIDFSEFNQTVIAQALEQAHRMHGEIFLIHVATLDVGILMSETGFTYVPELEQTALQDEAEKLDALKIDIEKNGIPCQTILKQGIPAEVIIEEANKIEADLIVIGSLGHNTLYNIFIGSVASEVIKHASVPILVVPKAK